MTDAGIEEPEEDVAEQRRSVLADSDQPGPASERPYDVDEADAAEQARAVDLDEDEYR
jgi:hypothetical protein